MDGMQRAAALVIALVFATSAAAATASVQPRVRLLDRAPATVVGSSFRPAERVVVTLSAGSVVLRKTVYAGARGAFVARWRRALSETCVSVAITATGSDGSRATYKLLPPDCAPPITP
jgi:hypothetical protein